MSLILGQHVVRGRETRYSPVVFARSLVLTGDHCGLVLQKF